MELFYCIALNSATLVAEFSAIQSTSSAIQTIPVLREYIRCILCSATRTAERKGILALHSMPLVQWHC